MKRSISGRTRAFSGGLYIVLLCVLTACHAVEADDLQREARKRVREVLAARPRVLRSPSARLSIIGHDGGENLQVSRWGEGMLTRIESLLGFGLPFSRSAPLTVRILSPTERAEDDTQASISVAGRRVNLRDSSQLDTYSVNEIFCRVILQACVLEMALGAADGDSSRPGRVRDVPSWLSVGLSRNLFAVNRGADRRTVSGRWQNGELLPLLDLMRMVEETGGTEDPSVAGCLVGWLLDHREAPDILRKCVAALARGERADHTALVRAIPDVDTPSDAEQSWDRWILAQRRTVVVPGVTSLDGVHRLHAALLLYSGAFGMPLDDQPMRPRPWEDLIADRRSSWVGAFCRAKAVDLQMIVAGSGDDLKQVSDAYCEFLSAVAAGQKERRIRDLLEKARSEHRALLLVWNVESTGAEKDGAAKGAP